VRRSQNDTPEQIAQRENARRLGSITLDRRIRRITDICSLTGFVWFILGNVWMLSSNTCSRTSPRLFYSSVAALAVGWLYVAEIIVIALAVVFFLPTLIIVLRLFGVGEKTHEIGPLSKQEIEKIPQVLYMPQKDNLSQVDADSGRVPSANSISTKVSENPEASPKGSRLWRLWSVRRQEKRRSDQVQGGYVRASLPYHPLPSNLASCPICLCDYEEPPKDTEGEEILWQGEPLRLLPCGHCVHSQCVDTWLAVSGRCPICQRAISSKAPKEARDSSGV